jgi:hypothetical protein
MQYLFLALVLSAVACLYLLPAIIAHLRRHKEELAITALNIFAGWTFGGWVIALIWACTMDLREREQGRRQEDTPRPAARLRLVR